MNGCKASKKLLGSVTSLVLAEVCLFAFMELAAFYLPLYLVTWWVWNASFIRCKAVTYMFLQCSVPKQADSDCCCCKWSVQTTSPRKWEVSSIGLPFWGIVLVYYQHSPQSVRAENKFTGSLFFCLCGILTDSRYLEALLTRGSLRPGNYSEQVWFPVTL